MQPPFSALRDELEGGNDPPDMAFDALMDELEGRRARSLFFESPSRSTLWLEHDLFRKPASTFRDHALGIPAGLLAFNAPVDEEMRRRA
jgi:hypothetical protein